MSKLPIFTLLSLAVLVNGAKVPLDLVAEAQEQLEQLRSLIQGNIAAAHVSLWATSSTFGPYVNSIIKIAIFAIRGEHDTITSEIKTLEELANGAGKDVTSCTANSEDLLKRLLDEYEGAMISCVNQVDGQYRKLLKGAEYFIDITINKVLILENQLLRCGDNIICIQPIVTEIQLDMVRLPASIKTEVNAFEEQFTLLRTLIPPCGDPYVASYVSSANSMAADITACINKILDGI